MFSEQLIIVALLGGLAMIDKSSLQMLFSEPIVLCAAAGAYLGDFASGLLIGMIWQVLWVGELPVGAVKIPDSSSGALISTCLFLQFKAEFHQLNHLLFTLTFIIGVIVAYLGGQFISDKRRFHARYIDIIDNFIERGQPRGIEVFTAVGLAEQFLTGAFHYGLLYFIFYNVLGWCLNGVPAHWDGLFTLINASIWGIAAAVFLHFFWNRKTYPAVILGLILGILLLI